MPQSEFKPRRKSLEIFPGHKYDPVNYLRVELNTAGLTRKNSSSRADEAKKIGLDNLYESSASQTVTIYGSSFERRRPGTWISNGLLLLESEVFKLYGTGNLTSRDPTVVEAIGTHMPEVIRQSPIDIRLNDTVYDPRLEQNRLTVSYPQKVENFCCLRNTGNTWKLRIGDDRFRITGGPLRAAYQLDQVHAHWGPNNVVGSEHTVNRYQYAGELHFVHWNTGKCDTINCAAARPDGLAVIGVFLKLGKPHPEIQKLTDAMQDIHYSGQETSLDDRRIDVRKLMPNDTSQYWTYDGSLTTTPYDDCVIWIVLKNHIEVSKEQLDAMRSMVEFEEGRSAPSKHPACGKMVHNYRPVQDQSRVKVRSSFRPTNVDYF